MYAGLRRVTRLPGSASGPCFAGPHSPWPRPSLHGLRSGRGHFVRPFPRYLGQIRLLHRTHRRLRPPAFPTTSRRLARPSPVNASRLPSQAARASLGASTVRYWFTVTDFHRLPFAGLRRTRPYMTDFHRLPFAGLRRTRPYMTVGALMVALTSPHAGMPMFALTATQREDVIAYILSLR